MISLPVVPLRDRHEVAFVSNAYQERIASLLFAKVSTFKGNRRQLASRT